jgi:hypothetical protein
MTGGENEVVGFDVSVALTGGIRKMLQMETHLICHSRVEKTILLKVTFQLELV